MFNFCSLYSGSSGNSLLVESENTKLLIDAGVSSKKIETALTNLNIDPASIDGILITHEHTDHVQGLGTFAKKFDLPVYVNQKTLDAMPKQKEKISEKNNLRLVICKLSHLQYHMMRQIHAVLTYLRTIKKLV